MSWLEQQLDLYGSYHTKLVTKITHFIGIPMVIFSVLLALAWFKISFPPYFNANFAWLVVIAAGLFYLYLDWRIGLFMLPLFLLMAWGASALVSTDFRQADFFMFLSLFVIGWAIQVVGHVFEGKRPAFVGQKSQLLIAPLFLVAEAAVMIGWRKDLRDVIQAHAEIRLQ